MKRFTTALLCGGPVAVSLATAARARIATAVGRANGSVGKSATVHRVGAELTNPPADNSGARAACGITTQS